MVLCLPKSDTSSFGPADVESFLYLNAGVFEEATEGTEGIN
jgi:hypothetical protein